MKKGRVVINHSICDNAPECSGIAVCPTGALYFDETKGKNGEISFNPDLCCDCGACADAESDGCPIGAILHAENDEEYEKFKAEVDAEERTAEELNVERYGASPIDSPLDLDGVQIFLQANRNNRVLIELFCDDSIHCLLHSIPISGLKNDVCNFVYKKAYIEDISDITANPLLQEYANKIVDPTIDLPILLAFSNGVELGRVSGYYEDKERDQLVRELKKLFGE